MADNDDEPEDTVTDQAAAPTQPELFDDPPSAEPLEAPEPKPAPEPQAEEPEQTPLEKAQEEIEDIVQSTEPRTYTFNDTVNSIERTYVQRPLSFFGKIEFFQLIGRTLDGAMQGEDGMSVDEAIALVEPISGQVQSLDSFVMGIARLAEYAPDLMKDSYCIFLAVPKEERPWLKELWAKPVSDGGMDDETGTVILETFFDQNGDDFRSFFVDRMRRLQVRARKSFRGRRSSKPSSTTPPNTPSR